MTENMPKILLFANTDWYLYNFRRSLFEKLRDNGWDVVLVSPPGEYGARLELLGFRWIPFDFSTRSTNPLQELHVLWRLVKLYRQERPRLCHHFTIKCVLYGSLATRLATGLKVVNAVTGVGHIFTDPGFKARLLRSVVRGLYRFVLGGEQGRVIFQNKQDLDYFVSTGLVTQDKVQLIRGSGVDCDKFSPVTNGAKSSSVDVVRILFASRLLREKGILELLDAARRLRGKGLPVDFLLAGDTYPGNPSSLTAQEVEDFKAEGVFTCLGHVDDMPSLLTQIDIVVLPSYREGTPRTLIEAAAMGKPIVATDIAGCRGLVRNGVNGLLVPVKDSAALADALERLTLDSELRHQLGQAGRKIVLSEFDEKIVLKKTFAVYRELIEGEEGPVGLMEEDGL